MDKSALVIYDQRNRRHTTDAQLGIPYTEVNNVNNVKIDPDFKEENIKYNVELLSKKGTFTGDASAEAGDILQGKSAYVKGEKVNGSIPKNGQLTYEASRQDQQIPFGYTTGGTVKAVTAAIDPDIRQENIKQGVEILGVVGAVVELQPEAITINPSTEDRVFSPTTGNGFVQVNVNGVTSDIDPNILANNIRKDVQILGVTGNMVELDAAEVTINPSTEAQVVRPPAGKNAISKANVNAVTSDIDANIQPGNIRKGVTILGVQGKSSVVDTDDGDATNNDIEEYKTAYVDGRKVTGVVHKIGTGAFMEWEQGSIKSLDNNYLVVEQDHSGSKIIVAEGGNVAIKTPVSDIVEEAGITPDKILEGNTILGVEGEGIELLGEEIEINPSTGRQVVTPSQGHNAITQVTVPGVTAAIDPNIVASNIKGGVTILGVTGNIVPDKPDQSKTVNPSLETQVVEPDTGYELASVTVNPVTSSIDSNITAANIRGGVSILGVQGTFTSDATAYPADIESGKTAYVNGTKITGTMVQVMPHTTESDVSDTVTYESGNVIVANKFKTSRKAFWLNSHLAISAPQADVASAIELTPDKVKYNSTVLGVNGSFTGDADAIAYNLEQGKTAYVKGQKITGNIPAYNDGLISNMDDIEDISTGLSFKSYFRGKQIIDSFHAINVDYTYLAQALGITPDVIKKGVTICGVEGTCEGESLITQEEFDETQATLEDLLTGEYQEAHEILNQVLDSQDEYSGVGGTPEQIDNILDEVLGVEDPQPENNEDNEENNGEVM